MWAYHVMSYQSLDWPCKDSCLVFGLQNEAQAQLIDKFNMHKDSAEWQELLINLVMIQSGVSLGLKSRNATIL